MTLWLDHYCGFDTVKRTVTIGGAAVPTVEAWLANGTEFCPGDRVIFDFEGEYESFEWDFGDGSTSTERKPSHMYATDGPATYEAILTVTNSCGNQGRDTLDVIFLTDLAAEADINIWFDDIYTQPCPVTPVEFETYEPGIYEWDFGDGSFSNEQKAVNYYMEPGLYYVTLRIWNGCGNEAVQTDSVLVMLDPSDYPYAEFDFDIPDWGWDAYQGDTLYSCPGNLVGFKNYSWTDGTSELSYEWDFSDGTMATSKDVSHTWDTPGAYPVILTVTNSCGNMDNMTRHVMVVSDIAPDATPGVVPEVICSGEEVYFYLDEGVHPGQYTFDIDFGDGQVLQNATGYADPILQTIANHTYTGAPGATFDYSFQISNNCGNTLTHNGTITITDDPTHKPFYYVDNSTSSEEGAVMGDWSFRRDDSDHEFSIHFVWPSWPGGQDVFRAYFWYEGFYPEDEWEVPDGFVEIQTTNALSGDSLKAYIPIDPLQPPIIGFAVFWSCDGNYPPDVQPEAWGMQWNWVGMQLFEFSLLPGGYTNMMSVGLPVSLNESGWDGICNTTRPGQKYYLQLNAGQYLQLSLEEGDYYSLSASRDKDGKDYITEMDYGNYYLSGSDTIMFYGMGDCFEASSQYRYVLNGRQMELIPDFDFCESRLEYLTAGILTEHTDTGAAVTRYGCPNDNIQFKIAGGIAWEWHFGDGSPVSNEQYPLHAYAVPGDYEAFVIATNACGRTDTVHTFAKIVDFNRPPAYFWWDGWDYPRLEPIQFHYEFEESDQAGNYSFQWDFGDENTSTDQNPVHAYEFNGEYTIKLTVTNGCGSSTNEQTIWIRDAVLECEAKIHIDSVIDRTVYFKDISRGEISNWFWDFGDGFTSSEQDPTYTYDYDGLFFVCLSVFDSLNDCAHQVCRQVGIGTQLCTADFAAMANHATLKVQFSNLSDASESFWDFGDGHYSDLADPIHNYTEPGWYPVCLSVYDEASDCYAYRCKEIMVGEENEKLCYADFNYFVDETNNSVIFTDLSSENTTHWYWTYGDGSFAEARDTVKVYRQPGIYEVCLFVFDENTGCADEICMEIPVGVGECNLRADFAFFVDINNNALTFENRTGGRATEWFWDFGDGFTSSARDPQHKYDAPGYYLVILSVWDGETGCSDHLAQFVQIGDLDCRSGFEYAVDPGSRNVQFYNQSLGTGPAFFWEFDDGTFSDETNPSHQFPAPGLYWVGLTVISDNETCMDFIVEPVQVGAVECAAKFRYFIDSAENVAYFSPEKIGDATAYLWFFGDGAMQEGEEALHRFEEPGYYTVGLNTFDETTGCMDYWEEVILIGKAGEDCRAHFNYVSDPVTGVVNFGNRSKGKIVEYIWDFGDGEISFEENPEHAFPDGYYPVCLTVVNNFGISNTFCDFVRMATGDDEPCFAEFFYTVDSATRTVEFVQNAHGNPDKFTWNFGDGSDPSIKPNPAHVYATSDYYLVELIVENTTTGCISNRFELVNVAEGNQGLRAAYSYVIDSSDVKATTYPVDFVGVSLGDAGKLKWDFGDGSEPDTTTLNPTHQYADPGTYYACLTVSNPITGDENQYCEWITAGATAVSELSDGRSMLRNYPNPFDQTTTIAYQLRYETRVNLAVFDQTGRMVDLLVHEKQPAGPYRIEYNASKLDSGIYTLRLSTEDGVYTSRMVVR